MRIVTLTACFLVLFSAAGSAALGLDRRGQSKKSEGKAKVPDRNSNDQTQSVDDPILPGRSGWYTNPRTGDTDIQYGDDWLPAHMRHLDRNQQLYPSNKDIHDVNAESEDKNRKHALKGVQKGPPQQVSGFPTVRDEKLPNMLIKPPGREDHTTVEYRDRDESNGEGRPSLDHYKGGRKHSGTDYTSEAGLLSVAKRKAIGGGNGKARLLSNPGWLPLDSKQRVAHEAPARLGTLSYKDDTDSKQEQNRASGSAPKRNTKGGALPLTQPFGETFQRERKAGDKNLRTLASNRPVEEPKTPVQRSSRRGNGKSFNGKTFLTDGTPARPPGEVWRSRARERPSMFGAPVPEQSSDKRQPPRPQDMAAYKKQEAEAKQRQSSEAAARIKVEKAAQRAGVVPGSESSDKSERYRNNLARFTSQHPIQASSLSSGHAAEAPELSNRRSAGLIQNEKPAGAHGQESRPVSNLASSRPMPIRARPQAGPSTNLGNNTPGPSDAGVIAPSTPTRALERPHRNPTRKAQSSSKSGKSKLQKRRLNVIVLRHG